MSLIDEALSANAAIADGFDPSRGKPPAPKIAIVTCAKCFPTGRPSPTVSRRRDRRGRG
jgi:hypothetical protein